MNAQVAFDLVRVKHVQRAVAVIGEEVGYIDKRRDRAQANRFQPILQPLRAGAVLDALDQTTGEDFAAVFAGVFVNADGDRAGVAAVNLSSLGRLHGAYTTGGQIQRNAAHAQRVLTVGGDGDLDHRIDLGWIVFSQPVDELVTNFTRGQFDDAVVFVRQFKLALGGHHAVAFNAADFADAQCHINPRHIVARLTQNHGDTFTRVRRAADDLLFAFVGFNGADAQTVGIGVLFGVLHLGQCKACKALGRVFDPFDFQTKIGQCVANLVYRCIGFEVVFQPGQGEFHGLIPSSFRRSRFRLQGGFLCIHMIQPVPQFQRVVVGWIDR